MNDRDLTGKVAIVTAANREIGSAMAEALAASGAAVLVAHYGEVSRAQVVVEGILDGGGRAATHEADLSQVRSNQQLVERAVELWGRLDIFAANAGLTINTPFLDTDEAMWDSVVDLNLKGSFFGAQAAARQMIRQGKGGRIVFSSSVTGIQAIPGFAAYGVTKAGLRHMARTLGIELGRHGITVNALGIGATLNERNLEGDPEYATHWAEVTPTGRVGQPADVAAALLYLVSAESGMVNGHTLMIDGGWAATSCVP